MNYRSLIILYCLQKLNGERSIFGAFHLLVGKKSSQTISDGQLYQLAHLFGTLNHLTREQVEESADFLLKNTFIYEIDPNSYKYSLTNKGENILADILDQKPLPKELNGWKYFDKSSLFWKRLSLLTQVLSNLVYTNKDYVTIQQDEELLEWVKHFLATQKLNRADLAIKLYNECLLCLEQVTELEASIFVMRLTSSNKIGYTIEQVSAFYGEDETWFHLLFINSLHSILAYIEENTLDFSILSLLVVTHNDMLTLTSSTRKTYHFLLQGKTIEEIASIRKLKKNTIEDHVVEITYNVPNFSIKPYVSKKHELKIITSLQQIDTKQLRLLKESVGDGITYFEIRLVLAKCGVVHESK
ncbi:helix-turn-helix domain-containing protein [Fredinandcohnia sp. SECRCQ15]|uniref:Helix-turn-helix domain-containing protein n=2 Tax=Fredinandcohnia quinoae TaxID=2918902 RepID=A0AAW5E0I2_9BACI|nr:helix-turn-helix domain-containing protein [Fredinandcohnia sp. SECRCQ15]